MVGCTGQTPCNMHAFWEVTLAQILAKLRSVSLADLDQYHDAGVERFRAKHWLPVPAKAPLAVRLA